jgi:arginyl-tRNA synthetase
MLRAVTIWQAALAQAIREKFSLEWAPEQVPFTFPPRSEMGDAATPVAFALAKTLKRPPAAVAQELAAVALEGIREAKVANGYLNLFVDRAWALDALQAGRFQPEAAPGKVIIEHTNINPNKAAHVGHLRNAVLGDTLVRALRYLGSKVEVQNYIDDTGVQVADVVVGFERILGWTLEDVRNLITLMSEFTEAHGSFLYLQELISNWSEFWTTENLRRFGLHGLIPEPACAVPFPPVYDFFHGALGRFDAFCWGLYARVAPWYAQSDENKAARLETLHLMEEGGNATADMAALIAEEMVRCHLRTMDWLGIRYDVLPHESDILKTGFWAACFEKLKQSGAVHQVPADSEDKNRGCWVMALQESEEFKGMSDADKVIVRSNGTVTYIGKDMAYQLWKFGLLGRDFHYRRFEGGPYPLWRTAHEEGTRKDAGQAGMTAGGAGSAVAGTPVIPASGASPESISKKDAGQAGMTAWGAGGASTGTAALPAAPPIAVIPATPPIAVIPATGGSPESLPHFGGGDRVINVIDVRQSYLQKIVKEGLRQMGYVEQAARSVHYAYEMVALSTSFVRSEMEKGAKFDLSEEDLAKPFVEMSGRKGLGFQADLLMDRMKDRALSEIENREPELAKDSSEEWSERAHALATAALRYYMVKYNKNQIVAFDLDQALAFEGDTGPYLQYACVRAEAILRKASERGITPPDPADPATLARLAPHFDEEGWAVLTLFLRVPLQVKAAADGLDLNVIARQFYDAAQAFHAYYHHFPVLQEEDPAKRDARLLTVALFAKLLRKGLEDLLGIPVPEKM